MVFDIFVFISDLAWENFVKYIRVLIYFDGNFKNDVIITCWRLKLAEASGIWYWKLKTEFVPHLATAMSEQLKYIVDELNKEPFKKNYNLIR